jgi:hypothetical protein
MPGWPEELEIGVAAVPATKIGPTAAWRAFRRANHIALGADQGKLISILA